MHLKIPRAILAPLRGEQKGEGQGTPEARQDFQGLHQSEQGTLISSGSLHGGASFKGKQRLILMLGRRVWREANMK